MLPGIREFLDVKGRDGRTRIEIWAELIAVNGGSFEVGGWGIVRSGPPPYNRWGLQEADEGIELSTAYGFHEALRLAAPDDWKEVQAEIIEIWKKNGMTAKATAETGGG